MFRRWLPLLLLPLLSLAVWMTLGWPRLGVVVALASWAVLGVLAMLGRAGPLAPPQPFAPVNLRLVREHGALRLAIALQALGWLVVALDGGRGWYQPAIAAFPSARWVQGAFSGFVADAQALGLALLCLATPAMALVAGLRQWRGPLAGAPFPAGPALRFSGAMFMLHMQILLAGLLYGDADLRHSSIVFLLVAMLPAVLAWVCVGWTSFAVLTWRRYASGGP